MLIRLFLLDMVNMVKREGGSTAGLKYAFAKHKRRWGPTKPFDMESLLVSFMDSSDVLIKQNLINTPLFKIFSFI